MKRSIGVFILALLAAGLALPPPSFAQEPANEQSKKEQSKKEKQKSDRAREKELDSPYKKWLREEVTYIISDEERATFVRLNTNEEREQFIEQFWLRRDPSPDTVENEYKEEHYRRIAYANERFASGIAGWRTDRGRIYIAWGPPDEIETHPTGGSYSRPFEEGGGTTTTYPFEKWRYRYLEGIGNDVNLEFVDRSSSNEYKLTMDPEEKDAMQDVPGAGLKDLAAMGQGSRGDQGVNGSNAAGSAAGWTMRNNQFERLELYSKIQRPPAVKFKDLEEVVNFRLLRNQIHFDYRFDYLRITGDTVLVPITIQIPNKELTYKGTEGVHSGVLNIFGRITTITGRIVQTFEDVVNRDFPDSLLQASLKGMSVYQKAVPLRPGLYKLDLVVKDVNSGNMGVVNTALRVPRYDETELAASSLIIADQIERVPARQIGLGQFVIGASKVRPRLDASFFPTDRMAFYLQIYNLGIDETSHKSSAAIEYRIRKDGKEMAKQAENSNQFEQGGEQLTIEKTMSLAGFAPGKYKLEIQITDQVGKKTITPSADFTIKPAEKVPEKTAAKN